MDRTSGTSSNSPTRIDRARDILALDDGGAPARDMFRAGVLPHDQGKRVEAGACYRTVLEPDGPGATHLLGMVSARTGRFAQAADLLGRAEAAIANFDRAISVEPRHFAAHFHRARVRTELNRWIDVDRPPREIFPHQ